MIQNVTKGARHKIVLSLSKLKERQDLLRSMEKVSYSVCVLSNALNFPRYALPDSKITFRIFVFYENIHFYETVGKKIFSKVLLSG